MFLYGFRGWVVDWKSLTAPNLRALIRGPLVLITERMGRVVEMILNDKVGLTAW